MAQIKIITDFGIQIKNQLINKDGEQSQAKERLNVKEWVEISEILLPLSTKPKFYNPKKDIRNIYFKKKINIIKFFK